MSLEQIVRIADGGDWKKRAVDDDVITANDRIKQMYTAKFVQHYYTVRKASTEGMSKPRTVPLSASP